TFDFRSLEGYGAKNFARFDLATGAVIPAEGAFLDDGFDGEVLALSVAGDSVYVGGSFAAYREEPIQGGNVVKLDAASGDLDLAFGVGIFGPVRALLAQESALFVGGSFASDVFGGGSRAGLVAVDLASGDPVRSFDPV